MKKKRGFFLSLIFHRLPGYISLWRFWLLSSPIDAITLVSSLIFLLRLKGNIFPPVRSYMVYKGKKTHQSDYTWYLLCIFNFIITFNHTPTSDGNQNNPIGKILSILYRQAKFLLQYYWCRWSTQTVC